MIRIVVHKKMKYLDMFLKYAHVMDTFGMTVNKNREAPG